MPIDLVERMRAAGVFRALQPRSFGGFEVAPVEFIEMIEELACADGSAGWTAAIGAGAPAFTAWLEPAVATQLFGSDADFTAATVFAPTGRAVPDGTGRLTIEGRGAFASGCRSAEWFLARALVFGGDAPRTVADQGPDWRLAYFPRANAEIVDNWDVLGCAPPEATRSSPTASAWPKSTPSARSSSRPATRDRCVGCRSSRWWEWLWSVSRSGSRGARSTSSPASRPRRYAPGRFSRSSFCACVRPRRGRCALGHGVCRRPADPGAARPLPTRRATGDAGGTPGRRCGIRVDGRRRGACRPSPATMLPGYTHRRPARVLQPGRHEALANTRFDIAQPNYLM